MLTHVLIFRQRSETSEPPVGAFGTSLPEEPTNGADVFTPDSSSGVQNLNSLVTPTCEASKDLKLAEKEKPSEVINQSEANALPTKQLNTIRNRYNFYLKCVCSGFGSYL